MPWPYFGFLSSAWHCSFSQTYKNARHQIFPAIVQFPIFALQPFHKEGRLFDGFWLVSVKGAMCQTHGLWARVPTFSVPTLQLRRLDLETKRQPWSCLFMPFLAATWLLCCRQGACSWSDPFLIRPIGCLMCQTGKFLSLPSACMCDSKPNDGQVLHTYGFMLHTGIAFRPANTWWF